MIGATIPVSIISQSSGFKANQPTENSFVSFALANQSKFSSITQAYQ
jgi:hypothetical protein